jgi:hypothetical protein
MSVSQVYTWEPDFAFGAIRRAHAKTAARAVLPMTAAPMTSPAAYSPQAQWRLIVRADAKP